MLQVKAFEIFTVPHHRKKKNKNKQNSTCKSFPIEELDHRSQYFVPKATEIEKMTCVLCRTMDQYHDQLV